MKSGRVVVVSGAAGGMGSLIVERFLANGDTVFACDIRAAELRAMAAAQADTTHLFAQVVDVSDEASCADLASSVRDRTAHVDVLVNGAGYFPTTPFDKMTLEEWNQIIGINLTGVFLMTRAMLPLMRGRGWGRIVNIGSASVFDGVAEQVHYVSAKAGILGFSRSLAHAIGAEGITVNVVTPGLTLTPPVKKNMPAAMIASQVKLRAIPRDEVAADLVGSVFFLASPDADFISGQTLNVDGGKHMS